MFSRERITHAGLKTNPRCMPLQEALRVGERLDGITHSLAILRASNSQQLDMDRTMVPVVDQIVDVHASACTTEQESDYQDIRVTIGTCALSNKCVNCILNLPNGASLLDSLKPFEIESLRA